MWVRIDDDLIDHDKVLIAGERLGRYGVGRVLGMLLEGLTHAGRKLTDGALPNAVVRKFKTDPHPMRVATTLADVGLWEPTEDGYQIHDYHHYNPAAADVKKKRAKDRDRKRGGIREDSARNPRGIQSARGRAGAGVGIKGKSLDLFEEWWNLYPKKKAKADAKKAWGQLKPDAELMPLMIAAVEAQRTSRDWTKDGGAYIPLPATWIRGRRWEDEETTSLRPATNMDMSGILSSTRPAK